MCVCASTSSPCFPGQAKKKKKKKAKHNSISDTKNTTTRKSLNMVESKKPVPPFSRCHYFILGSRSSIASRARKQEEITTHTQVGKSTQQQNAPKTHQTDSTHIWYTPSESDHCHPPSLPSSLRLVKVPDSRSDRFGRPTLPPRRKGRRTKRVETIARSSLPSKMP